MAANCFEQTLAMQLIINVLCIVSNKVSIFALQLELHIIT